MSRARKSKSQKRYGRTKRPRQNPAASSSSDDNVPLRRSTLFQIDDQPTAPQFKKRRSQYIEGGDDGSDIDDITDENESDEDFIDDRRDSQLSFEEEDTPAPLQTRRQRRRNEEAEKIKVAPKRQVQSKRYPESPALKHGSKLYPESETIEIASTRETSRSPSPSATIVAQVTATPSMHDDIIDSVSATIQHVANQLEWKICTIAADGEVRWKAQALAPILNLRKCDEDAVETFKKVLAVACIFESKTSLQRPRELPDDNVLAAMRLRVSATEKVLVKHRGGNQCHSCLQETGAAQPIPWSCWNVKDSACARCVADGMAHSCSLLAQAPPPDEAPDADHGTLISASRERTAISDVSYQINPSRNKVDQEMQHALSRFSSTAENLQIMLEPSAQTGAIKLIIQNWVSAKGHLSMQANEGSLRIHTIQAYKRSSKYFEKVLKLLFQTDGDDAKACESTGMVVEMWKEEEEYFLKLAESMVH